MGQKSIHRRIKLCTNSGAQRIIGWISAGDNETRFKSHRRFDSITFPSHGDGNKLLPSGQLFVQGMGNIKVKLHRPVHGKIKTVSVKRQREHWYVCFSVETSVQPLAESEAAVGIDVGLSAFAVLSDGSEIENPRLYQKEQKRLRRAQRRVARRKKPKRLSDREHVCTKCGLITTRDHASATEILRLGLSLHTLTKSEIGTCVVWRLQVRE